jgi:hypothetical protein
MKLSKKQLIISLIKDDLINSKLLHGLDRLGLYADDYMLHLADTIFKLLEIPEDENNEELFMYYMEQRKRTQNISIKSHHPFEALALDIYIALKSRKSKKAVAEKIK